MEYNPYLNNSNSPNLINMQIAGLSAQMESLKGLVGKYEAMGNETMQNATQTPAYPINRSNPQSVEDIIADPTYKENLMRDFWESETGKRLREEQDAEFLVFCEKKTRYPSTTLDSLRGKSTNEKQVNYPVKKAAAKTESALITLENDGAKSK